ncbi:DNA recombination protein RmuC [Desulfobacterota bacterium AH_259_B03_O07]|nr:DNA recombination protein RmuC [Desulfobacterota bacterium AH_259_B03_O07]
MSWIPILISLILGIFIGLGAALVLRLIQAKTAKDLAEELYLQSESKNRENLMELIEGLKESFGSLSLEALSRSTEEFLKLAKATLEPEREATLKELDVRKEIIDRQLQRMTGELDKVSNLMKELERDRVEKFGELASQLKTSSEQTASLMQTTHTIREALASTKVRGQWGERMAEDILQLSGLIENVNYLKQKAIREGGSRPDFTFLLPNNLKLNMDVKFPLDNYVKYLEAGSESERANYKNDFLRDVKARIKEVTTRDYIDPGQNTVDCMILFIPNEQIYSFIHEQERSIFDNALKNKVVLCSPINFFAVLSVIRQAVDNFALEKTSGELLSLFGRFKKQWDEFLKKLELLGKRISDTQKEYESLITTRRRQLESPLDKIEYFRNRGELPIAPEEDEEHLKLIKTEPEDDS